MTELREARIIHFSLARSKLLILVAAVIEVSLNFTIRLVSDWGLHWPILKAIASRYLLELSGVFQVAKLAIRALAINDLRLIFAGEPKARKLKNKRVRPD